MIPLYKFLSLGKLYPYDTLSQLSCKPSKTDKMQKYPYNEMYILIGRGA